MEAGASARRKYNKLHEAREQHAREKLGRLSGACLALTTEPQSTRAWGVGSSGERRLGAYLETLNDDASTVILHDRRIPGSRANIDHIAVWSEGILLRLVVVLARPAERVISESLHDQIRVVAKAEERSMYPKRPANIGY